MDAQGIFIIVAPLVLIMVIGAIIGAVSGRSKSESDNGEYKSVFGGKDAVEDYVLQQMLFDDHHKH